MDEKLNEYNEKVDLAIEKINNNIKYFDSFGDFYITKTVTEHLKAMLVEIEKTKSVVNEINKS